MPLAGLGWEGEHEANNREPEDLPGDEIFPSRGAGDPTKELLNVFDTHSP